MYSDQMKTSSFVWILVLVAVIGCSTQRKLSRIQRGTIPQVSVNMANDTAYIPEMRAHVPHRDTLIVQGDHGEKLILMKAIQDAGTGEMVAHDVLDAAIVTAKFRNVAERNGKVDLVFQIHVPAAMQDSKWQLRFYPDLFILEDSIRLQPVIITGVAYRKAQLRGYQQYERFLSRIVSDTTRFINMRQLELFIRRNIPQLYAFKSDTSYVSDEVFASVYGVTEQQAIEHYTDKVARNRNQKRIRDKEKVFQKYVQVPIVTEGIRLDTVITDNNGDFVYNYVQQINVRPRLRKADIILSGEIYEQDRKIYSIPPVEPLTFYISSVSSFADKRERYITRVIERRAQANTACYVSFAQGSSTIEFDRDYNREELARVRANLIELMENRTFELDSIVVSSYASPEGSFYSNEKLSKARSESISNYLNSFMTRYQDSLIRERGFSVDEYGRVVKAKRVNIPFISHSNGENWSMLDWLVQSDSLLTKQQKSDYNSLVSEVEDPDKREKQLSEMDAYAYIRSYLYPRLRVVNFDFHLHRKGMVKDTVHTTELDTTYMRGVQLLRDMDYENAIKVLAPYADFNTAVAYTALNRNASALAILSQLDSTAEVNYMKALLNARTGDERLAVDYYLKSCRQNKSYINRGNLDPEISALIKIYGLHAQDDDDILDY